jgi:hypothetical protein
MKKVIKALSEFLNTTDEWHAFIIGFFEVLCPLPARVKLPPDKPEVIKEYLQQSCK